jgi:hypothetical protein
MFRLVLTESHIRSEFPPGSNGVFALDTADKQVRHVCHCVDSLFFRGTHQQQRRTRAAPSRYLATHSHGTQSDMGRLFVERILTVVEPVANSSAPSMPFCERRLSLFVPVNWLLPSYPPPKLKTNPDLPPKRIPLCLANPRQHSVHSGCSVHRGLSGKIRTRPVIFPTNRVYPHDRHSWRVGSACPASARTPG